MTAALGQDDTSDQLPTAADRRLLNRVRRGARRSVPEILHGPMRAGLQARRAIADRRLILAAGAFDLEWYEAQTGIDFAGEDDACWHYLWQGRKAGMSPHPLFEPSVAAPKAYRTANFDPLVTNLGGRAPKDDARVHPALPKSWGNRDRKTGLPRWLAWAKSANVDTVVPSLLVAPARITWGEFRAGAIAAAEDCRRGLERRRAPVLTAEKPDYPAATVQPAPASTPGEPLVTVVMPTWNRAGMLRRAVESVQRQTLTDWELVVVDDGSDDDSLHVLEGLAAFEPRLRVIPAEHGGVCRARNIALDAARGRYVAFLDTDNEWTPDFLRRSVDFAIEQDAPWVFAALQIESKGDSNRYRTYEGSHEQLLHGNYIDMNVLVAERALLKRVGYFDESLRRAVDYDLILRLSEASPPRLVPMIGAIYQDDADDPDRISVAEPMAWNYYVSLHNLVDFAAQRDRARIPGRVSVVLPVRDRPQEVADIAAALRETVGNDGGADIDLEVIVAIAGPNIQAARALEVAALASPYVTVVHRPTEFGWAAAADLGAARATGEYLVLWRPNSAPHPGWWAGLHDALRQPGVGIAQALAVRPDGRINSAGAVFVGHDPFPSALLSPFPVEDAAPLHHARIPAPFQSVIALRADTFWEVGGLDAILGNDFSEVDLSLRVKAAGLGDTIVSTAAQVTSRISKTTTFIANPSASVRILRQRYTAPPGSDEIWNLLGFEQTGRRVWKLVAPKDTVAELGAHPVVRPVVNENPRRLRWALDVAAEAEPSERLFAQRLAAALRELGQQVHVDAGVARDSAHRDFDDVTLVLRGTDDTRPRPGAVSLLWVLTDPATGTAPVTAAECAAHDRVFAAGAPWAAAATKRWGIDVEVLPTCIDAGLFRPGSGVADDPAVPRLVFVGDSGGLLRPAVKGALAAGVPLHVYGRGWTNLLPDNRPDVVLTDESVEEIAADRLPAVFAAASVVLWDHPGDARHDGFYAPRVPEVLASGGRLLCDDVAGLREQFPDVVEFGADHDLAAVLGPDWATRWPDAGQRLAAAETVRAEHSFAARAATLLDEAVRLR